MKIATWHNLVRKTYEATVVGRGRPIQMEASEDQRKKSSRTITTGKSAVEAASALCELLGVKVEDVEVVSAKDTKIVYKGKREHSYTKHEVDPVTA